MSAADSVVNGFSTVDDGRVWESVASGDLSRGGSDHVGGGVAGHVEEPSELELGCECDSNTGEWAT